jgi:hypothetical protein
MDHSANDRKIDDDGARLALSVFDGEVGAVAGLKLGEEWQGVVIIAETHGFTDLQRIEGAEDGGMTETLGDTAGIEGIEGCGSRLIAGMNGVDGLHVSSEKDMPGWQSRSILPGQPRHFLDPDRNNPWASGVSDGPQILMMVSL